MARSDAQGQEPTDLVCRFNGCDADATGTVGTVALCSLHRSLVEELMDRGDDPRVAAAIADAGRD